MRDPLLLCVDVAADILDLIQKFIRLAVSNSEENEARNSAVKAVKLIAEHKVVLTLPGQVHAAAPHRVAAEPTQTPAKPSVPVKVRDIHGVFWTFYEDGVKFGGHCVFCALPMMRGQSGYTGDRGSLHVLCWNERQNGKLRPGPAPKQRPQPTTVPEANPVSTEAETAAVDDLWSKINPK